MYKSIKLNKIKIILFLAIGLNIISVIFVVKRIYWTYLSNTKNYNEGSFKPKFTDRQNRANLFEVLPKDNNSIIFLGNSLTQQFEVAELFKSLNVKNRGISGDKIVDVLNRISPIIKSQPKKIFIEIGINDLGQGIAFDNVLKAYKKLLDTLKESCPMTKLYVQTLLPVANSSENIPMYCNPKINSDIKKINLELQNYSKLKGFTFIDLYHSFNDGNHINLKYTYDGLHISGEAYLLWASILKPYVN